MNIYVVSKTAKKKKTNYRARYVAPPCVYCWGWCKLIETFVTRIYGGLHITAKVYIKSWNEITWACFTNIIIYRVFYVAPERLWFWGRRLLMLSVSLFTYFARTQPPNFCGKFDYSRRYHLTALLEIIFPDITSPFYVIFNFLSLPVHK
jgi:hypothetical protein